MIRTIRPKSKLHGSVAVALALLAALAFVGGASFADEEASAEAESTLPGSIDFVARNMLAKAKGTFHEWSITRMNIDRANPAAGEVEVEVDIASIDTGIGRRDNHLRTDDFFDVEKFPKATVRVHDAVSKGKSEDGLPLYGAQFTLKIRDVEKTIEGEFTVTSESPPSVEGELELSRTDFGVGDDHNGWNPMSVKDAVIVRFTATFSE